VLCVFFVWGNKNDNNTDSPQTKTKHTTQKAKMISNTDPPQTKTKHTLQKTKMTSSTDPHKEKQNTQHRKLCVACHFSFLCCVFCFCLWGSVLLVILAFCIVFFVLKTKHTTQKTKIISNTDPHKQKQNTQHR
jgi:hypothetical protein